MFWGNHPKCLLPRKKERMDTGWHLAISATHSHIWRFVHFASSALDSLPSIIIFSPGLACSYLVLNTHSLTLWPSSPWHPVQRHNPWLRWAHHPYFLPERYTEDRIIFTRLPGFPYICGKVWRLCSQTCANFCSLGYTHTICPPIAVHQCHFNEVD